MGGWVDRKEAYLKGQGMLLRLQTQALGAVVHLGGWVGGWMRHKRAKSTEMQKHTTAHKTHPPTHSLTSVWISSKMASSSSGRRLDSPLNTPSAPALLLAKAAASLTAPPPPPRFLLPAAARPLPIVVWLAAVYVRVGEC